MKSWWIKIYCRSKFPFHINTLKSICFPVPINTVQWAIIYIFLLSVFVQHLHLVCNFTRYIHYQNVVSISLFTSLVTWGWLCFLIHWEYLVLLVTHACVVCRVPTWLILSATTKACNAGSNLDEHTSSVDWRCKPNSSFLRKKCYTFSLLLLIAKIFLKLPVSEWKDMWAGREV